MKKPRRMFRERRIPEMTPEMKASLDKMRDSRAAIDPFRTYCMQMPNGQFVEATGAELIATAEATVSLHDAINRGESPEVLKAAFERLDRTFEPS